MNALPPRNAWRDTPVRVSPHTGETAISPSTTGMWHDWQLLLCL